MPQKREEDKRKSDKKMITVIIFDRGDRKLNKDYTKVVQDRSTKILCWKHI